MISIVETLNSLPSSFWNSSESIFISLTSICPFKNLLVATKRFLNGQIEVKDIKIDSEEFQNDEGKLFRVSTIEITLSKK